MRTKSLLIRIAPHQNTERDKNKFKRQSNPFRFFSRWNWMYRRLVAIEVLTTYYVTSLNLLHPIGFVTVNDSFTSCTAMSLNVRRSYTMSTLTMMNMNAIAKWNIDLHVKQFPLQIIITSSSSTAPAPSATISTASGREWYEWNEEANE